MPDPENADRKLVLTYLHCLILALRTNSRFSSKNRFVDVVGDGPEAENPLMASVLALRNQLCLTGATRSDAPVDVLQPFVDVVRSPHTPAPITAVALQAFLQFLELRCTFLDAPALEKIAHATMDARLEVTDSQSHEAVLGKIIEVSVSPSLPLSLSLSPPLFVSLPPSLCLSLCVCVSLSHFFAQVLVECVRHPSGAALSGPSILKALQTCCRIALAGPPEPSELLRRTAEQAIQDILSLMFAHVRDVVRAPQGARPVPAPALVASCCPALLFVCQLIGCDSVRALLAGFAPDPVAGDAEAPPPPSPAPNVRISRVNLLGLQLAHYVVLILQDALVLEPCGPLLRIATDALPRTLVKLARARQLNIVVRCSLLATVRLLATYTAAHIQPQLLSFLVWGV